MANYNIRIKISGDSPRSPNQSSSCVWECPYCHGRGRDPHMALGSEPCPACHGHMYWEADVKWDNLQPCSRCEGTGKINYLGNWAACPDCKGAGKV